MSDYDTQTTGYGYDEPFPVKNIPYMGYNGETDTPTRPQNYIPIDKTTTKPPSFRIEYLLLGGAFLGLFIRAITRR